MTTSPTPTPTPFSLPRLDVELTEAETATLQGRDYTMILCRTTGPTDNRSALDRAWKSAYRSIQALLTICEKIDQDGVILYTACHPKQCAQGFQRYDRVNSQSLSDVLIANYPPDCLDFSSTLHAALGDYFQRRAQGKTKPNGETIIALIDGEPGNRSAIARMIVQATEQISHGEELSIGLLQVGDDPLATGFFTVLDNDLHLAGAKFDIVDTQKIEEITPENLCHFLIKMIKD
jgi:hypothetical protein